MKLLIYLACMCGLVALQPGDVKAQLDTEIGLEGHVFTQSGKLLSGALIQLNQQVADRGASQLSALSSDSSGAYSGQIHILSNDPVDLASATISVAVICSTKKRVYSLSQPFYNPLRPGQVYQRDFYVTVPSSVKSCR